MTDTERMCDTLENWMIQKEIWNKSLYDSLIVNNINNIDEIQSISQDKFDGILGELRTDRFLTLKDEASRNKFDEFLIFFEKEWRELLKEKEKTKNKNDAKDIVFGYIKSLRINVWSISIPNDIQFVILYFYWNSSSSSNLITSCLSELEDATNVKTNELLLIHITNDNITDLFMSYISRMHKRDKIDLENLYINFDDIIPKQLSLHSMYKKAEIDATKLSYSLMKILSNESETVKSFLSRECKIICQHSLSVFHPSSKGNVYHSRVILEILMKHCTKLFMETLINDKYIQSLLKYAIFRNLHQGNLNIFFLDLLSFRKKKNNEEIEEIEEVKKKLIKMFAEWKFIKYILSISCDGKQDDIIITNYSFFFIDIVAKCASIQEIGELFVGYQHLMIDSFIVGLLDENNTRSIWHKILCGQTLVQLLDILSRPTIIDPDQAMAGMLGIIAPDPSPNILHSMFADSLQRLQTFIPKMCDKIINKEKYFNLKLITGFCRKIENNLNNAYYVVIPMELKFIIIDYIDKYIMLGIDRRFGQIRLYCLQLLCNAADFAQFECGNVLAMFKFEFFDALLTMSFTYSTNNLFLQHFRRLIYLIMIFRRRILKHLFINNKMLERFVDFYENKSYQRTALHGFIIQMLSDIYNHEYHYDDKEDDEDDDILKPNYSKYVQDEWNIISFFDSNNIWKQFCKTVSLEMEKQNKQQIIPNSWNNPFLTDPILSAMHLGCCGDDDSSTDSSSDSDED